LRRLRAQLSAVVALIAQQRWSDVVPRLPSVSISLAPQRASLAAAQR
jgi:hypothetical protein